VLIPPLRAQMWYTNYTHVPVGVPVMPDGDPRRTFTDYSNSPGYGPGVYSPRNPWRAPGAAPVNGPCGGYGGNVRGCRHADGTPAPCVIGGRAYGPDAVDLYNQGQLAQNIKRTRWQRGAVVEAAYTLYSNHAGGYSCKSHFASLSPRLRMLLC
jgi:hypothetical protein